MHIYLDLYDFIHNFFKECDILTKKKKRGIDGKLEEIFGIINGKMEGGNKRGRDGDENTASNKISVSNVISI